MKRNARKRCEECGRVYDGSECPECGRYATLYEQPEDFEKDDDNDEMEDK